MPKPVRKVSSAKSTREQELEDEISEKTYELAKAGPNISQTKKDQMTNIMINLTKALREERLKNHESGFKDKAQQKVIGKQQEVIEELHRKNIILEKNSSKIDTKEVQKHIEVANAPIATPKGDRLLQKKYDNYANDLLEYLNNIPGIKSNEKKN